MRGTEYVGGLAQVVRMSRIGCVGCLWVHWLRWIGRVRCAWMHDLRAPHKCIRRGVCRAMKDCVMTDMGMSVMRDTGMLLHLVSAFQETTCIFTAELN